MSRNGTATEAAESIMFPVNSFRDAATYLRRPFTPAAVKFKVQATWPKASPTGGLIVAYIDARLAVERLNLIVPHLWHDEYEALGQKHLICRLTVDGITRQDIGEGVGKGLYSDALKRAAVKFGVGVSLYAIPKMMLNVSDGHLKASRDSLQLTTTGEGHVRYLYVQWLEHHGKQAFGAPLDHGDVDDAQGDPETEDTPAPQQPPPPPTPVAEESPLVSGATIAELIAAADGLKQSQVKLALSSVGIETPQPFTKTSAFNTVPQAKAAELAMALTGAVRN